MTPEDYNLLMLLPGLHAAAKLIQEQIEALEQKFSYVKPTATVHKLHTNQEKPAKSGYTPDKVERRAEGVRRFWARLSPEERKRRIAATNRKRLKTKAAKQQAETEATTKQKKAAGALRQWEKLTAAQKKEKIAKMAAGRLAKQQEQAA